LIAIAFSLVFAGAARADGPMVILESNVARYPPGAIMRESSLVSLLAREELRFIDEAGVVRRVTGRFNGRLGDIEAVATNQRLRNRSRRGLSANGVQPPELQGRDHPEGAIAASRGDDAQVNDPNRGRGKAERGGGGRGKGGKGRGGKGGGKGRGGKGGRGG